MCGLAGIFNLNGRPVAIQDLKPMGESIAHRGPDGEGFYIKENLGIVHK
ncbi:MAG: asparagine synthase (glutamine-hydrolyzing), partial [Parvicella sp.]